MTALSGIAGALSDASHRRRTAEQAAAERWRDPEFRRFQNRFAQELESEESHYLNELQSLESEVAAALKLL